jgi:hypothetical protein
LPLLGLNTFAIVVGLRRILVVAGVAVVARVRRKS